MAERRRNFGFYYFMAYLLGVSFCQEGKVCQPFQKKFELCRNMPYNVTLFPNILQHRTLEEAIREMEVFSPLIRVACSDDLEVFLCSVYAPFCRKELNEYLYPCKSLCETAKNGCIDLMKKFGFRWPEYLSCDIFPEYDETNNNVCLKELGVRIKPNRKTENSGSQTLNFEKFYCPSRLQKKGEQYNFMSEKDCAATCKPTYFTSKEKDFARIWVLFWSVACMLSTAFTLLTFVVDMPRFRYPERPIIFLSGCYFMVATAFIAGPLSGNAVACHTTKDGYELLNQGTDHASCTVVFMIIYFFLMAASIWWVILTLTWFLAAGLKWGHEAIEASSPYFHVAAWAIPAAITIGILAMNKVDGDALSGVCFVGGKDIKALQGFVIAPLFICLIVGTFFLFAGFIALIRIRKVLKTDHSLRTDKLTRLMIRIGIFSVLYSLPAIIVIACLFYEQAFRGDWDKSWIKAYNTMLSDCGGGWCSRPFIGVNRPDFAVFMIKYLMMLMVGITSGFWIWSGKTIQSWRMFYYNQLLHQPVPRRYETRDGSSRAAFLPPSGL